MLVICCVLDSIEYRVSELVMKKPMGEIEAGGGGKWNHRRSKNFLIAHYDFCHARLITVFCFRQMLFRTHKTNQSKSVKRKRIPFLCFAHVNARKKLQKACKYAPYVYYIPLHDPFCKCYVYLDEDHYYKRLESAKRHSTQSSNYLCTYAFAKL